MEAEKKPVLSVIIVNYNVKEFLANCLQSVQKATKTISAEIFVVDNNSTDGSMPFLKDRFKDVIFIENDENVGFGKANNQAIRRATGNYTLLLNPDTLLQEDTIEVLIRHMEQNEKCGVCGCKILNPDGTFAPESRRSIFFFFFLKANISVPIIKGGKVKMREEKFPYCPVRLCFSEPDA